MIVFSNKKIFQMNSKLYLIEVTFEPVELVVPGGDTATASTAFLFPNCINFSPD